MPSFAAFLSYIALMAFTPGPNTITALSNSGKYGFRRGFRFCLGVGAGIVLMLSVVAVFSKGLLLMMPKVAPYLRYVGAAYVLFLAWAILQDKPRSAGGEKPRPGGASTVLSGILLQFVNAKAILYGLTAMTSFILPYYEDVLSVGGLILLMGVNALVATTLWALFGAGFERLFSRHKRILHIIMALLLLYCAITILLSE